MIYSATCSISGEIVAKDVTKVVSSNNKKFFPLTIKTKRKSGNFDLINVLVDLENSKLINDINDKNIGDKLFIKGDVISKRVYDNNSLHYNLFVVAKEIKDVLLNIAFDTNKFVLSGKVYCPPKQRLTPSGKRITDICAEIPSDCSKNFYNRFFGVCWNDISEIAKTLNDGDDVYFAGRLQSRTFVTKEGDGRTIVEPAYYYIKKQINENTEVNENV